MENWDDETYTPPTISRVSMTCIEWSSHASSTSSFIHKIRHDFLHYIRTQVLHQALLSLMNFCVNHRFRMQFIPLSLHVIVLLVSVFFKTRNCGVVILTWFRWGGAAPHRHLFLSITGLYYPHIP